MTRKEFLRLALMAGPGAVLLGCPPIEQRQAVKITVRFFNADEGQIGEEQEVNQLSSVLVPAATRSIRLNYRAEWVGQMVHHLGTVAYITFLPELHLPTVMYDVKVGFYQEAPSDFFPPQFPYAYKGVLPLPVGDLTTAEIPPFWRPRTKNGEEIALALLLLGGIAVSYLQTLSGVDVVIPWGTAVESAVVQSQVVVDNTEHSLTTTFLTRPITPPPTGEELQVEIIQPPTPSIEVDLGETVTFRARATGGEGEIEIKWLMPDNGIKFGEEVTHTFNIPGEGKLTVTATDEAGEMDMDEITVMVNGPSGPLTATILTPTQTNFNVGVPITFSTSISGGTAPYSIEWFFPDGTFATGANVTKTFAFPGQGFVYLTVRDNAGAKKVVEKLIVVVEGKKDAEDSYVPYLRFYYGRVYSLN